jgi:hypothetical protein
MAARSHDQEACSYWLRMAEFWEQQEQAAATQLPSPSAMGSSRESPEKIDVVEL